MRHALALAPMQPPDSPAATGTQAPRRLLVLPPLLAIVAWQAEPTAERRLELVHALERVAELLGLVTDNL